MHVCVVDVIPFFLTVDIQHTVSVLILDPKEIPSVWSRATTQRYCIAMQYSARQHLRNSYFGSVSRLIFSPVSAEMLNSIFFLGEEVQNARFLKFRLLFCKGVQCDLISCAVVKIVFSMWHPSLITHKILVRNDALQDYRHHSSSWPPSTTLL